MPGFPDLHQPLSDGAVSVRLTAEHDIPEVLIAYQDDPELHLRLGEERPPSAAVLGRRSELAEVERRTGRALTLTIAEMGAGTCRGEVRSGPLDSENRRVDLEVWVAPQLRRRGLASGALRLAAQWLLSQGGLERVGLLVEVGNEPMLSTALSAGFVREARLRSYAVHPARRRSAERVDTVVFSKVRSDLQP